MTINEKILAGSTATVDTFFSLGDKVFEGARKLTELNLQTSKTLLAEAQESTLAALSAKDAAAFMALQTSLLQPAIEKAAAYSRHVYEIVSATGAEFTKTAEANAAEAHKAMLAAVEAAAKGAPAGSEQAVALMKSAFEGASSAYEGLQKATKQATEAAEATFESVADTAVKSTQVAVSKSKRAEA